MRNVENVAKERKIGNDTGVESIGHTLSLSSPLVWAAIGKHETRRTMPLPGKKCRIHPFSRIHAADDLTGIGLSLPYSKGFALALDLYSQNFLVWHYQSLRFPQVNVIERESARESVVLDSLGDEVAGALFLPASSHPSPSLIVCHGAGDFKENYFEL